MSKVYVQYDDQFVSTSAPSGCVEKMIDAMSPRWQKYDQLCSTLNNLIIGNKNICSIVAHVKYHDHSDPTVYFEVQLFSEDTMFDINSYITNQLQTIGKSEFIPCIMSSRE